MIRIAYTILNAFFSANSSNEGDHRETVAMSETSRRDRVG